MVIQQLSGGLSGDTPVSPMMPQLVAGALTPPGASRVHTEWTVGGSDLRNKVLGFRLRCLKQNQGGSIQGSYDQELLP